MEQRKTALVTGSGRGLGYGIAYVLINAGYDVGLHYNSSADGAIELKALAESKGQKAYLYQANIRNTPEIKAMFEKVDQDLGGLDLFVNNSGITKMSKVLQPDEDMFDSVFETNLKGAYFCVSEAGNNMVKHGKKGSIAIIGSNHLACVWATNSVYAMFKLALSKFTQHAAIEMAKHGIRVNMVAPGYVDTSDEDREKKMGKERMAGWPERKKMICRTEIPMHRFIPREEVGEIILFLASPAAASITGITMICDGGAHLLHCDPAKHNFWEVEEE